MPEAEVKPAPMLAFEEFELFYKSTERVSDQRLALNRWNYAICTAILIACVQYSTGQQPTLVSW